LDVPWPLRYELEEPFSGYGACVYTPPPELIESCLPINPDDLLADCNIALGFAQSKADCEAKLLCKYTPPFSN
jgi:hypothetical protein